MLDNEASETTSLFRNTGFLNKQPHIHVRANGVEPKISDSQSVFLATLRGFPGGPLQGWQERSCGSYLPDLFFYQCERLSLNKTFLTLGRFKSTVVKRCLGAWEVVPEAVVLKAITGMVPGHDLSPCL